ncbi:MAG: DNA methyltransferase [Nostocales cyanobacterium 94392]|nr:DNA methyltransferase [Nostocales cyanobacterium 94392]
MELKAKEIQIVDIGALVLNPKNNNKHPKEQIERLAKLIEFQGFRNPVVVSNRTGFVVAGHGRIEAAKMAGLKEVPVMFQDFENEAQEYAYLTSDNAIASWANIDLSMVNTEMLDLGPDFDIDLLGIKDFVIEPIEKFDPLTDEDEVPEVVHPITRRGDIWLLGNHRLMCGDSTMIDDVEKLMNGEKADMVFTDPPYNVAFNGRSGKHDIIKNDNLSDSDFSNFIEEVCQVVKTINPAVYYIWCNWKFYGILQGKLDYKTCIVWAKNVFGLGNGYRHQHEFCLFNGKIDEEIKNESDLWEIKKDHNYVHPTQKPVALSVRAFGNHIKLLNVLDLFGGSGSTMIGAEQTGRRSFLMELDEKYCDVIINRWQNFTGKKATLELTGQTYEELKKERENVSNG